MCQILGSIAGDEALSGVIVSRTVLAKPVVDAFKLDDAAAIRLNMLSAVVEPHVARPNHLWVSPDGAAEQGAGTGKHKVNTIRRISRATSIGYHRFSMIYFPTRDYCL